VFLASHINTYKKVAIHKFNPLLPGKVKWVIIEARVLSNFEHSGIVKLLDCEIIDDTLYWIVEYFEGVPLSSYLKTLEKELSEKQIIYLFKKIIDAVQYLHSAGFIHQNLNLNNILITTSYDIKILKIGFHMFKHNETNKVPYIESIFKFENENIYRFPSVINDIYSLIMILFCLNMGKEFELKISDIQNKNKDSRTLDLIQQTCINQLSENMQRIISNGISVVQQNKFVELKSFGNFFVDTFDDNKNIVNEIHRENNTTSKATKNINHIKLLISKNDLFEAIDAMLFISRDNKPELYNQVVVQSSSLHNLTKKINLGIIYEENSVVLRNQIVHSLINIADEIES